jgi:hypothetical protein
MTRQMTSAASFGKRNSSTKSHIQLQVESKEILSVASSGQLLVGKDGGKQLHVCSENGELVKSLTVPFDDALIDAVWSPHEHHIVYTTYDTEKTMVMSVFGDIMHQAKLNFPRYLSVSPDSDIYVTSIPQGIYCSTDNGTTWHRLVSERGWRFGQALKVTPNNVLSNYTIWAIETDYTDYRLSIYTPDKQTWTDVVLPNAQVKLFNSRMVFDGHTNIYMSDWHNKAVHVWSVNGQYVRQLVSPQDLNYSPENLALNRQRSVLYVAEAFFHYGFTDVVLLQT